MILNTFFGIQNAIGSDLWLRIKAKTSLKPDIIINNNLLTEVAAGEKSRGFKSREDIDQNSPLLIPARTKFNHIRDFNFPQN